MLTGCHAHLHHIQPSELPKVVQHAKDFGVGQILALGMDVETSKNALRLADLYEGVYAGIGIHPMMAHQVNNEDYEKIRELAIASKKVVCLGGGR